MGSLKTKPKLVLRICDSGSAILESQFVTLFQQPTAETEGMGIGLYQSYRQAEAAGVWFGVGCNEPGRAEFVLCEKTNR